MKDWLKEAEEGHQKIAIVGVKEVLRRIEQGDFANVADFDVAVSMALKAATAAAVERAENLDKEGPFHEAQLASERTN